MSRILLVGHAPFDATATRRYAGQLRTLQLLEALRGDGNEVMVMGGRIAETFSGTPRPQQNEAAVLGAVVRSVEPVLLESGEVLRAAIAEFQPAAVVGAGTWASACVCRAAGELPVWADLHGDAMAEGQAKAAAAGDDAYLRPYAWRAWNCLLRADYFSVVSRAQRQATLGQLALAGRLNRSTFAHELVTVIHSGPEILPVPTGIPLRGGVLPSDALLVLWLGGWNNWADVDTCFAGVAAAMQREPRLHFVATGGVIAGHEEDVYARFARRVEASELRARFHLLGWMAAGELARVIDECDVALVVDLPCAETELGCRTRAITALGRGLPVLATRGAEALAEAAVAGAAELVASGDNAALAVALTALARDVDRRKKMAAAGRNFAAARTPAATAAALVAWALRPRRAPDAVSAARPDPRELLAAGGGYPNGSISGRDAWHALMRFLNDR